MAAPMRLVDVCNIELISLGLLEFGASVGLKLRRAGVLRWLSAERICGVAAAGATPLASGSADGEFSSTAELHLLKMGRDCPDEVLVHLLPHAQPTALLRAAASRNFRLTSLLLLEHDADLHHVEVRRGRKRGIVDMAARGAGLDNDWRLVAELLGRGARAEAPQGVLFAPLRRGEVELARTLMRMGALPEAAGLASLLCDVCAHGARGSAALLIDDFAVPVNAPNERDGDTCTDRALAWHCWEMAEWLVACKGGVPAKVGAALCHVLDAACEPGAARVLATLRERGIIGPVELLTSAVQRGDFALCRELLAAWSGPEAEDMCGPHSQAPPLVDLALCHGHLRIALALLQHGVQAQDASRARRDVQLHGNQANSTARQILELLPSLSAASSSDLSLFGDDETPDAASGDSCVGFFGTDGAFSDKKAADAECAGAGTTALALLSPCAE